MPPTYINPDIRSDAGFPPVFQCSTHPLMPRHMSRALVFILGVTRAERKRRSEEERRLRIPYEKDEVTLKGKGYIKLQHGDMLFGRSTQAEEDQWQDDVVLGWLTDGRLFTPAEKQVAEEATLTLLGPSKERKPERVAIEALGLTGINGSRCLTFGPTTQEPSQVISPSAKLKLPAHEEGLGEIQAVVKEALEAFTPLAIRSIEQGPSKIIETLKDQTDLASVPHIGCDENWAFPSMQCNIAAAKRAESDAELGGEMGHFGDAHGDPGDAKGFFTTLLANPQLPAGYDPGRFFLLYLGAYTTLEPYKCLNFSGRQAHGATAPRAPPGVKPVNDAHRCNLIFYPPSSMTSGKSRHTLASHQDATPLYLTPEMIDYSGERACPSRCNAATWAKDGDCLLPTDSMAQFMTRGCLQFCRDIMGQVPERLKVEIDADAFYSSISYVNDDGKRVHPEVTNMTPRYGEKPNADDRQRARKRFRSWEEQSEKFYPLTLFKSSDKDAKDKQGGGRGREAHAKRGNGREVPRASPLSVESEDSENLPEPEDANEEEDEQAEDGSTVKGAFHGSRANGPQDEKRELSASQDRGTGRSGNEGDDDEWTPNDNREDPPEGSRDGGGDMEVERQAGSKRLTSEEPESSSRAKSRRTDDNAFLRRLSFDRVQAEVRQIEQEARLARAHLEQRDNSQSVDVGTLYRLRDALKGATENEAALTIARELFDKIQRSELGAAAAGGGLRAIRAAIIDTTTHLWDWIENDIPNAVKQHLRNIRPGTGRPLGVNESWLATLTREVADIVSSARTGDVVIQLPRELNVPRRQVTLHIGRRYILASTDPQYPETVSWHVQQLILQSLHKQHPRHEQLRAWVVRILKRQCGSPFLRLDCAWDMFINFRLRDYTHCKAEDGLERDMARCEVELDRYLDESGVRSLIRIHDDIVQGRANLTASNPSDSKLYRQEWERMLLLVRASHKLLKGEEVRGNGAMESLVEQLREQPNRFFPFREKAPDLQRARSEGGFYHASAVKTTAGIFSALIWRVISFNTPFARERPMLYPDSESYLREVASCPDSKYVCQPNAYGQHINGNGPHLAKTYWHTLTSGVVRKWEDFVATNPSFDDCLKYFRTREGRKNVFPGLGNLLSSLLVFDLSYAGICPTPTLKQMSRCIAENKGGSLKELAELNLIPKSWPTRTDELAPLVEGALMKVQQYLERRLTSTMQDDICYDIICLEHILCKARKLGGKGLDEAVMDGGSRNSDVELTITL
ncbi:hypothetical protein NMY22_g14544 [Coprinellus aureogranulatus]|nr:hypothetical protein NMY22_g14544 [Coprinellus aureogranulatus]